MFVLEYDDLPSPHKRLDVWFSVVYNSLNYKLIFLGNYRKNHRLLSHGNIDRMLFIKQSEFDLIVNNT